MIEPTERSDEQRRLAAIVRARNHRAQANVNIVLSDETGDCIFASERSTSHDPIGKRLVARNVTSERLEIKRRLTPNVQFTDAKQKIANF